MLGTLGAAVALLTGCGSTKTALDKPFPVYSQKNTYTNQVDAESPSDYFAEDLCVTNSINFGLEEVDSQVAQGAGVFNVTTGEVLYNQNVFERLYPASTTKVLTAYIILRDSDLSEIVTVSESAANQGDDASVCGLRKGDNITIQNLLYGLMLESGNDAADALAEAHSGSVEAFAEEMNRTAHELGATGTHFVNPSGYPHDDHYTAVYDMYLIMNEALKNEKFKEIIGSKTQSVVYSSENGKLIEKTYRNNNRYHTGAVDAPEGFTIVGGKTGTTFDAGYCLVLYSVNEAEEEIISIVFKADGRHNLYLLMNQILSEFGK